MNEARTTASATAAQGAAWLIAFGITLSIAAVFSFLLPLAEVAVLVAVFQGGVALPLAFALERRLGTAPMAQDHPLRSLSVQIAMVQIVALPAVIMMYTQNPALVPAVFAAIGGAHFLPYVWLHQTKISSVWRSAWLGQLGHHTGRWRGSLSMGDGLVAGLLHRCRCTALARSASAIAPVGPRQPLERLRQRPAGSGLADAPPWSTIGRLHACERPDPRQARCSTSTMDEPSLSSGGHPST